VQCLDSVVTDTHFCCEQWSFRITSSRVVLASRIKCMWAEAEARYFSDRYLPSITQ